MNKSSILLGIFIFILMFIFINAGFVNATYYNPPHVYVGVQNVGIVKTCDDILVNGTVPDAFYPFPSDWLTYPSMTDYLETYTLNFTVKLQYYDAVLCVLSGGWCDYNQKRFSHKLVAHYPGGWADVYLYEISSNPIYAESEEYINELMSNFDDINLGKLRKKDVNWRIYVEAHGEVTYKYKDCFNNLPWDICTCGLYCMSDTPPYDINKEYNRYQQMMACCSANWQCGEDHWVGNNYCKDNDVWKERHYQVCNNPGDVFSYCEEVVGEEKYSECGDSSCGPFGNNYCKNDDVWKNQTCRFRGCLNGACYDDTGIQEEKVQDCPYFCNNGNCIRCNFNSDCGSDGWTGSRFCSNNDVWQNYRTYTCNNPGTTSSSCSYTDTSYKTEECGDSYCESWGSNYCKNGNVYHSRTCHDKGCGSGSCYSNPRTDEQLVQDCGGLGCQNGQCTSCSCGSWQNIGCGQGGCATNKMYQTRTCTPSGCSSESICVDDASCQQQCSGTDISCGTWPNCLNCNSQDGCYGISYWNYYCSSNSAGCGYNVDDCNDCSCSCGGYSIQETIANGNCNDGKDNDCDGKTDSVDEGCQQQQKCIDGTAYKSCSFSKPLYCSNGNLINNCSYCGCFAGSCQQNGICSYCSNSIERKIYSTTLGWQLSSIQVNSNDNVLITASGIWAGNINGGVWYGPNGTGTSAPSGYGYLASGLYAAGLVARINSFPPFNIGFGNSMTSQSGELQFGFNDCSNCYDDNAGNMSAYICIISSTCNQNYKCEQGETNANCPSDCNNLALVSFSAAKNTTIGSKFNIKCDYGIQYLPCITARHGNSYCSYVSFEGTKAVFECTASQAGNIDNYCELFDNHAANVKCTGTKQDKINNTNVTSLVSCNNNYKCEQGETNENCPSDCNNFALISFNAPNKTIIGKKFNIKCDYGQAWLPCITARHDDGYCNYVNFEGTKAVFECEAKKEGLINNYCELFDNPADDRCKGTKEDKINDIDVNFNLTFSYAPLTATYLSSFNIKCDYNILYLPCISAKHGDNYCSFSSWEGNAAVFTCQANKTGTINNYCKIFNNPADVRCYGSQSLRIQSTYVS